MHERDEPFDARGARATRFTVEIQHRVDNRRMTAHRVVHHIAERLGVIVQKSLDPWAHGPPPHFGRWRRAESSTAGVTARHSAQNNSYSVPITANASSLRIR